MYNSNTDSLGLILDVDVFFSLGHCSGALWVVTVMCHFLSHFSFNFEIVSAHLEANIQNFLKCPQFLHFEWMWRKLHTAIFPQMTKEHFTWGTLYKPLFSSHVTKQNSWRAEGSLFTGCLRKLDVHSNGHN